MSWLRRIVLSLGILSVVTIAAAGHYYYKGFYRPLHRRGAAGSMAASGAAEVSPNELYRLSAKAAVQKVFLQKHGYNTGPCFLVDMRLPSGKNRFFVYDLRKDSIVLAGLVAHGAGAANFSATPSFSNISGSGCTSLGKYRIGYPYQGQFGRAYKLYGLDATNDQAFARNVVLHSFTRVPEGETYPYPICNSLGCAMVAPGFLQKLQPLIDRSGKPVLLWIFD
ncbi:MAG TPA: murein L,D-transpeptidase catalytic domain family protein [Puia sp.]